MTYSNLYLYPPTWCAQLLRYILLFVTSWTVAPRLHRPWNSPGKNTGAGYHFLLQGIFPAQGSNPHFLSSALAGRFFTTEPPEEPYSHGARSQRYYSPIMFYSGTEKKEVGIVLTCFQWPIFWNSIDKTPSTIIQIKLQQKHRAPNAQWLVWATPI